jgi:hypothetical protein
MLFNTSAENNITFTSQTGTENYFLKFESYFEGNSELFPRLLKLIIMHDLFSLRPHFSQSVCAEFPNLYNNTHAPRRTYVFMNNS